MAGAFLMPFGKEIAPKAMQKLKKYKPTHFMVKDLYYDRDATDFVVVFVESLSHTRSNWAEKSLELIVLQERILRDECEILKLKGYRQFNMAYIDILKKQRKVRQED